MIIERTEAPGWTSNVYLVADQAGGHAVLIDGNGVTEPLIEAAQNLGVSVDAILITHWHGDHIEELDAYKQFSMCINCMLCYAACPVYGLDPDFVGPAAIALAERYDLDSRDQGARERLDVLIEHEGVYGCTFVGECTRVCPKHVDPAGAIQRYKLKTAQESVKAFLLPRALRR